MDGRAIGRLRPCLVSLAPSPPSRSSRLSLPSSLESYETTTTVVLAFAPGYWFYSTETWSDVPATVFILAGTVLSIHAARRNSLLWGALGGLSLGYACLIRYPSVLAVLPLAVYLLLSARGQSKPGRGWAGTLVGLGVFCGVILFYNTAVYGGPFQSGYSPDHGWVPWAMFSWRNFVGQSPIGSGGIQAVLQTLWNNMHIGLLLALVGLWRMPRPAAALIGLNALLFSLLYAAYLWPSRDARFVMVVLPMIALAGAYTLHEALERLLQRRRVWMAAAAMLVIALWTLPTLQDITHELTGRNAHGKAIVARVLSVVNDSEPDSVWLSQKYHDVIILYGRRTALYFALLAPPDPERQVYDVEGYATHLTAVIDALLEQQTPVYLIKESPDVKFRQGPIDPYPVLVEHYALEEVRQDPQVYRVTAR